MEATTPRICPDRVAIYIRWSTEEQGEGTTAEVQHEGCRHYLLSQGWTYRPELVFIDEGYSGGDLNRPALTRLRRAVQDGEVDCVVLFKIDRLSRSVVDTVNLVLREWEGRCYVKSAREPIDTTTAAGKMFFYTLVSFAEWERSVIRDRTMSGKLKRLHEGKNPGFRPPYGLRTGATPGSFEPVPEEARVVRLIFDAYLRGAGCAAIAADLNRRGIPFREGRPWSARTVGEMLRNPIYAGRLVYGRRVANPGRHRGGPRQVKSTDPPMVVESPALPVLVDPATFDLAQRLRRERAGARGSGRSRSSAHLLTGVLRCRCGSALVGVRARAADYYVCHGKRTRGPAYCDAAHIRQDQLDAWLVERLLERYADRLGAAGHQRAATEAAEGERKALTEGLRGVQRELDALDRQAARIAREYREGRLTLGEYREQRALIAEDRAALLGRRERLAAALRRLGAGAESVLGAPRARAGRRASDAPPQEAEPEGAQNPGAEGLRGPKLWESLPHPVRKRILRALIHRLTVYRAPGSAVVQYRLTWVESRAR